MICINNKIGLKLAKVIPILFGMITSFSQAGVVVGGTRFVYSGSQLNGISFSVKNTSHEPFLIQVKALEDNGKDVSGSSPPQKAVASPFMITPPLFRLRGQSENTLRVIRLGGDLPNDRESLFYLTVAAIPSGKPEVDSVQIAIRSHFKLFYRPANVKGDPSRAYQLIKWQRNGNEVIMTNPTPFYVTLFQVKVNGTKKDGAGMIPPFSSRTQPWCPNSGLCQLQWQSLNDFGGILPAWYITPTPVAELGRAMASNY